MPNYFFQIDGGTPPIEHEAVEAASLAVKLAGQSICDAADNFWDTEAWKLTSTDENGLTLFTRHFVGIEAPSISARKSR